MQIFLMLSLVVLYRFERGEPNGKTNHSKSFQFINKIRSSASTVNNLKVALIKVHQSVSAIFQERLEHSY